MSAGERALVKSGEAPRPCPTCATVTPHVRERLLPSARLAVLAVVVVATAGIQGGSTYAALALGLALGGWAVSVARSWDKRVCARCAKRRHAPTERPFRHGDEISFL